MIRDLAEIADHFASRGFRIDVPAMRAPRGTPGAHSPSMFEVIDHVQLVRVTGGAAQPAAQPPAKKQPASPQPGGQPAPQGAITAEQLIGFLNQFIESKQANLAGLVEFRDALMAQLQGGQPQGDGGAQPAQA